MIMLSFYKIRYVFTYFTTKMQIKTATKRWLNRGERSNTYLTHVCGLPWSVESLEQIENREKSELPASIMAFISCRWVSMKATVLTEGSNFFLFSQDSLCSIAICRYASRRWCSFLPYLVFFFFVISTILVFLLQIKIMMTLTYKHWRGLQRDCKHI